MTAATPALRRTREVTERSALTNRRIDWLGIMFQVLLLITLLVIIGFLFQLIFTVVSDGWGVYQERGTSFLTDKLSTFPERAGISQPIRGSLLTALFVVVLAIPLGIATAVYLEEYAKPGKLTNFVNLNIRNLAGVPSVVYGLLGLAVFVELLKPVTGGRTVLAGGLTLSVVVLPIVIITSAEAIRAVPQSLREGGLGLGGTQSDVTKKLVLPNALPGILTGTVLSVSRALGETAPLLLAGAFYGTFFTAGNGSFVDQLQGAYATLPVQIYSWAGEVRTEFTRDLTAAAILALLVITTVLNLFAILLRNRYDKRW
jgi:phosphate transport system permease protein